jgi:hypothetical protein
VFEAMLDKALQLCGAGFGLLDTFDGESIGAAAHRGVSPAFAEFLAELPPARPGPSGLLTRFLRGERFVHLDVAESEAYRAGVPIARALAPFQYYWHGQHYSFARQPSSRASVMFRRPSLRHYSMGSLLGSDQDMGANLTSISS